MDLKKTLKELKRIEAEPCVSVLLNTHRTHPANAQDPINLKNLLREAEERLLAEYDKRHVWPVMEQLNAAAASVDHNTNLDTLALFATHDMHRVVKLPVGTTDRVIIDHNFATRDLMRALQAGDHYYILTLSGHQSRLIEAYADSALREFSAGHAFPIPNRLYNTHQDQRAQANVEEDLRREFCNRVDKALLEVHKDSPLPVMLAGDDRNVAFYREVADKPGIIIGHISGSPDEQTPRELAEKAHGELRRLREAARAEALARIGRAQGAGRLIDDIGDMFRAAGEGRGEVFFAEEGFFQPARIEGDVVAVHEDPKAPGVMDDIVDEIAERTLGRGGEVVFLPNGSLAPYRGACMVTRY
jgi:hypothetical protein